MVLTPAIITILGPHHWAETRDRRETGDLAFINGYCALATTYNTGPHCGYGDKTLFFNFQDDNGSMQDIKIQVFFSLPNY